MLNFFPSWISNTENKTEWREWKKNTQFFFFIYIQAISEINTRTNHSHTIINWLFFPHTYRVIIQKSKVANNTKTSRETYTIMICDICHMNKKKSARNFFSPLTMCGAAYFIFFPLFRTVYFTCCWTKKKRHLYALKLCVQSSNNTQLLTGE